MNRSRERGEGKIGCILSLLVLAAGVAVGFKVAPVLYTNNDLIEFSGDLATKAGLYKVEALQLQLRDKAKELGIVEALDKGALGVTTTGEQASGTCTVRLHYRRVIDLYGLYPLTIDTDKTISRSYIDAR